MAAWIKMPLGMEVNFGSGDLVLDRDPAPPPQKGGRAPKFSSHVYCRQTAGWINAAGNNLEADPQVHHNSSSLAAWILELKYFNEYLNEYLSTR